MSLIKSQDFKVFTKDNQSASGLLTIFNNELRIVLDNKIGEFPKVIESKHIENEDIKNIGNFIAFKLLLKDKFKELSHILINRSRTDILHKEKPELGDNDIDWIIFNDGVDENFIDIDDINLYEDGFIELEKVTFEVKVDDKYTGVIKKLTVIKECLKTFKMPKNKKYCKNEFINRILFSNGIDSITAKKYLPILNNTKISELFKNHPNENVIYLEVNRKRKKGSVVSLSDVKHSDSDRVYKNIILLLKVYRNMYY
jgi:hypothetical protein